MNQPPSVADLDHPLLAALRTLPPNRIYADTPKQTLLAGFRLYRERGVQDVAWDRYRESLTVTVHDNRSYPVYVGLEVESPVFQCRCTTGASTGRCRHVVCAQLTLTSLLRPNLFRIGPEDTRYRKTLLEQLLTADTEKPANEVEVKTQGRVLPFPVKAVPPTAVPGGLSARKSRGFEVILEEEKDNLLFFVEKRGAKIDFLANRYRLPPAIQTLLSPTYLEDKHAPLIRFFKTFGRDYPALFRSRGVTTPLRWVERLSMETSTALDVKNDLVIVEKFCASEPEKAPLRVFANMAFDPADGRLTSVEKPAGWRMWHLLRRAGSIEPSAAAAIAASGDLPYFELPVDLFNKLQCSFDTAQMEELLKSTIFKKGGRNAPPLRTEPPAYVLSLRKSERREGYFVLTPQYHAEGSPFSHSRLLSTFARGMMQHSLPASLRAKKRRPFMFSLFFQVVAARSKHGAEEIMKAAMHERDFGNKEALRWGKGLLRACAGGWKKEEVRLHWIDRGWGLVPVDRTREMALYAVPYRLFGKGLFDGIVPGEEEILIHEKDLFLRLQQLQEELAAYGIEVRLEDVPVISVTWEFEVDASSSAIDWFEIKPEITCKGKTVDRGLWEQALSRNGIVYNDGALHIVDSPSLTTLSALLGLTGKVHKTGQRLLVTVPRLRMLELCALRNQGVTVRFSSEDEEILEKLTGLRGLPQRTLPTGLRAKLRHYQKEGFSWLAFLHENRFGACLADDMGLGKTLQALALLAAIKESREREHPGSPPVFLIVVPPSLLFNWEKEMERFCPGLKIYVYRGRERSTELKGVHVILTSYGLIRRDIEKLKEFLFDVIVFDEAQAVKNIFANTTGAVRQLRGRFKLALTGTPVENHPGEYFSILDLVLPGLLGEYKDFQHQAKKDLSALITVIAERTKPFILRRTKAAILKELPPKVENNVYLELTEKQKRLYTRTVQEVKSTIDEAYRNKTGSQAKIIALTAIMRLRQICLTPRLLLPDLEEESPKIAFLKGKLAELQNENHSALVFSQFTSFLDLVEEAIKPTDYPLFRLDGSTPVKNRKDIVESFQQGAGPAVFLLSLKAGGQGLNLTKATYVFHLDPWWNPAVENQASDRTHRIGQKQTVIVTRIVMSHTVEEKMMELKRRKLSLYKALMESPEKSSIAAIAREDFDFLLSGN
jgi:superfamily II DNA or RNA helicase